MRFLLNGPIPWLGPGMVISILVAAVAAGRIARILQVRTPVAFLLVVSLGLIVSATVTPLRGAIEYGAIGGGSCDVSRLVPLAPTRWLTLSEQSLNIAMFIPLGLALGLVPRSPAKAVLVVAALALPLIIELIQLATPVMARGCETADVIDNLSGLLVGLGIGTLLGWLGSDRRTGEPTPDGDPDPVG